MSEEPKSPELQFDREEYDQAKSGPPACCSCAQPIRDAYWDMNGEVVCGVCRESVEQAVLGGSGASRFFRAAAYGTAAAAVGSAIYYAVLALTGYEVGLVAIVVGLLVGGAVRRGSNGRGGWLYQGLAMFLTYSAIVTTYMPYVYKAIQEAPAQSAETAPAPEGAPPPVGEPDFDPSGWPAPLRLLVGLAILFAIAFVGPFLGGLEDILGLLIIGIGLFEAWKLNQRFELRISGPHLISSRPE
jgi:hypothetical protein